MSQTKNNKKKLKNVTPSAVNKKKSKNVTPSAVQNVTPSGAVQCHSITEKAFATPTSVSFTDKTFATPSPAPSNQQDARCDKCGFYGKDCHETKYRLFCLHGVMDYFDDVGFDFSDDLGVYTAYSKAYSAAIKKDTLDLVTFYERQREVDIPLCMLKGSLRDAQNIRYCNRLYQYLLATRVYNVSRHVEDHKHDEKLAFPERDIDEYSEE